MKPRKTSLVAALILWSTTTVFSQDSPATYSQDIGFGAGSILSGLFGSGTGPATFLYKKYTHDTQARRLGITLSTSLRDGSGTDFQGAPTGDDYTAANIEILVGKEFQKPIAGRWVWYYGGDIVPGFGIQKFSGTAPNAQNWREVNFDVAIRPFLGLRFNINERLYLATETGARLAYNYRMRTDENPNGQSAERSDGTIALGAFAATSIYIYYRF